jgi:hypothetical protein
MRKLVLAVSSLFALASLAGCASRSAGYSGYGGGGGYLFGECEYDGDCYGRDTDQYTCVFFEPAPRVPTRRDIALSNRHSSTRVVHRGDGSLSFPQPDSSNGSTQSATPPSTSFAPAPVAREPVVLATPSGDRSPRPH